MRRQEWRESEETGVEREEGGEGRGEEKQSEETRRGKREDV